MQKALAVTALAFAALAFVPTRAQERPVLEPGKIVERELTGDQAHSYALVLSPNQIARVVADQRGVDLVLSVFAPNGNKLFDIDSPNGTGGSERATIATREGGRYRVDVRSNSHTDGAGRYAIRLDKFLSASDYQTERLADLGRVWGALKFFHPFLAYKPIDWDAALIKAIPAVKSAFTPAEYRAAIATMLEVLNDPATTAELSAIEHDGATATAGDPGTRSYYRIVDDVVVVNAADWASLYVSGDRAQFAKQPVMFTEIRKASGVVIDCRYTSVPSDGASFYLPLYLDTLLPSLVKGSVPLGTERYRAHSGYPPQRGNTSGGYESSFPIRTPGAIVGQAQEQKPLAVLVNERTPDLLPTLSGLQAAGAKIVQVGDVKSGAISRQMMSPNGVRVNVRVAEFVPPAGAAFRPDVVLATKAGAGNSGVSAAIAALKSSSSETNQTSTGRSMPEIIQGQKDNPYSQMAFPTEEYRLLALFRFWNVIQYFYPYKHLIDEPWETVLTDFIPRFGQNQTALDYQRTVAEMVARMQDTHGAVNGLQALGEHLGTFAPPVRLGATKDGQLTIVELSDERMAQTAGVRPGDVILTIDGQPAAERVAQLTRLRSLSTRQAGYAFVYPTALRGAKDTTVKLQVTGIDGKSRDVELTRTVPLGTVSGMLPRKTPVYQVLPSGYGYIDLARLPLPDAQKAMDMMMRTPAIIFDMRGYPNGTAWAIAPRLTRKENITAAIFRRPLQMGTNFIDEDYGGRPPDVTFEQKLPPNNGAVYTGRVVMLINEFAISQSEHTCLFFESATNVTFIGSPTNGANGDVTNLVLPGDIYVNFSGHDVRHADGRQLQRVGIQPHVRVDPTPKGISEGRDEVLEAALKYLDAAKTK